MRRPEFDPIGGLAVLGELVRLIAPPAGPREICEQGLALTVKSLGPARALLMVREGNERRGEVSAVWGRCADDLAAQGDKVLRSGMPLEEGKSRAGIPRVVALPLPGDTGPAGAVVLEKPSCWTPAAQIFARSAARAVAAALRASRSYEAIRAQGELLAQRNLGLETLREFAARQHGLETEEELLQTGLDLILENLGLDAGWIFWGEADRGKLELAVSRGISDQYVERAREEGIGDCLCQEVISTGQPMYARNTTDCPRFRDLLGEDDNRAHACVPLKFERGIHGVLNISNRPGQLFTSEELQFLETFGHQLCLAVDKERIALAESRRNAEARALASLARAIGGSLEEHRVLAAVGEYGRELLGADRCAIFLGDDPKRMLFAYLSGPAMEGIGVGQPVNLDELGSRALLGALTERRTLVIEDTERDPRASVDLARRWGVGSTVIVPLQAHGQLGGILFATRSPASTWRTSEIELASTLAEHAALAIENARLYRETQESLVRLQGTQAKMIEAERLATVGTLASSLAHEVRNPLNSINLQLTLLSRRLGRQEPPPRQELADLIDTARQEIARLDGLVNEFLSLSTLDHLSLAETDPSEVVREVNALMGPMAQEQGIVMSENLAEALPRLPLDREKIKQVLINLVRNAIEAMPRGGKLSVSSRLDGGSVTIDVADTGVGIEPGRDVFKFFTTTKPGGTGLGLPIARGIVEAHGGNLAYESTPGRGTIFSVTLRYPGRSTGEAGAR